ncbi:Angiopoietin-1-like [Mactra antiquata]
MIVILYRTLLLLIFCIPSSDCLECLSCHEVDDEALCTATQTCNQSQSCYRSDKMVNNKMVITEGCIDKHQCGIGVGNLIGRDTSLWSRRQAPTCFECCSTNQCNSALCRHQKPSACVDQENMDCATLSSIFNICADTSHAKTVCPNFCDLCDVVDGNWTSWSEWTQCAVTCDHGTISRYRTCSNPPPKYGGLNCSGNASESKQCLTATPCPVDGNWSEWGAWGRCSASCEIGIQIRDRTCSNPKPDNLGNHCFGPNRGSRLCDNGPCTDGGWSSWSTWSSCTSKCGIGIKTQSRSCTNPKPSPHGNYCVGDPIRVDACRVFTECPGSYEDCLEIKHNHINAINGVYNITLWKTKRRIQVFCDMNTSGGGWTVFQNRFNGTVDFFRNHSEYVDGFGNLRTEFWLGLDYVQEMTSRDASQLRIDLTASDNSTGLEVLDQFSLGASPNYVLNVGQTSLSHNIAVGIRGNFGPFNNGAAFSTYDRDVDRRDHGNCAAGYHGAWWYNDCTYTNLNGQYLTPGTLGWSGTYYKPFNPSSLKKTRMSFRRSQT